MRFNPDGQTLTLKLTRGVCERTPLVWSNLDDVPLPADVLREVYEAGPPEANVAFEVRVNPGLDSGIRVYRIANKWRYLAGVALRHVYQFGKRLARPFRRVIERGFGKTGPVRFDHTVSEATAAGAVRADKTSLRGVQERVERALDDMTRMTPQAAGPRLRAFVLVHAMERVKAFAFPKGLHVALTTYCDLKCVMCPYHADDLRNAHTTDYFTHGKRMPAELLEKVIEEAGRHGCHLGFGQYDEPFMYKGFTDYAVLAKAKGCSVSITTNGTQLTEDRARQLIQAGVDHISFSLDAATEDTYRKIRLSDYTVPLENLRAVVRARNESGGKTVLRACLVVQERNKHEQSLFTARMKALGLDMVSFYVLSKYAQGVWINERLNFDPALSDPSDRHACSQLWSQMAVYPDGNVALCCATTLYVGYREDVPYVGNIKNSTLEDIWLSAAYRTIRSEALDGVFGNSVCRDCQIWHNAQHRHTRDEEGHLVLQNPYETFVYFR